MATTHGHRWWLDPIGGLHFEHDCVHGRQERILRSPYWADVSGPELGLITINLPIECTRCGIFGKVVDGEWVHL